MNGPWPSVGVVIPNHERLQELLEAIASVKEQRYKGHICVYVVFQERPGVSNILSSLRHVVAIPYCDEEGKNPIAAKRNAGLSASTEDLVAFLDDDDIWHPLKLAAQVVALQADDSVSAIGTRATYFSGQPRWNYLSGGKGLRDRTVHRVISGRYIGTSSLLVGGETARRLRFDERPEWIGVEDYDFKIRLSHIGPIRELKGRYTAYRADNASASLEERQLFLLRAVSVLATSVERDSTRIFQQLLALRFLLISALGGYGAVQEFHGSYCQEAEELLDQVLDGRLYGRLDPLVRHVVKTGWRRGWTAGPMRHIARTLRKVVVWLVRMARSVSRQQSGSLWIPPCGQPRSRRRQGT